MKYSTITLVALGAVAVLGGLACGPECAECETENMWMPDGVGVCVIPTGDLVCP